MPKKHTKNFDKLRNKIILENAKIENAIAEQKQRVRKLQQLCDHKGNVVMSRFESGLMFDHHELRLCKTCGIQESGWNPKYMPPGYGCNKTEVEMDRDSIWKLRSIIRGRTHVNIAEEEDGKART